MGLHMHKEKQAMRFLMLGDLVGDYEYEQHDPEFFSLNLIPKRRIPPEEEKYEDELRKQVKLKDHKVFLTKQAKQKNDEKTQAQNDIDEFLRKEKENRGKNQNAEDEKELDQLLDKFTEKKRELQRAEKNLKDFLKKHPDVKRESQNAQKALVDFFTKPR